MKKYIALGAILILLSMILTGCGETINGLSKDVKRIGKGVKTVFVRDE